jgi:hypothetical protein
MSNCRAGKFLGSIRLFVLRILLNFRRLVLECAIAKYKDLVRAMLYPSMSAINIVKLVII